MMWEARDDCGMAREAREARNGGGSFCNSCRDGGQGLVWQKNDSKLLKRGADGMPSGFACHA